MALFTPLMKAVLLGGKGRTSHMTRRRASKRDLDSVAWQLDAEDGGLEVFSSSEAVLWWVP